MENQNSGIFLGWFEVQFRVSSVKDREVHFNENLSNQDRQTNKQTNKQTNQPTNQPKQTKQTKINKSKYIFKLNKQTNKQTNKQNKTTQNKQKNT